VGKLFLSVHLRRHFKHAAGLSGYVGMVKSNAYGNAQSSEHWRFLTLPLKPFATCDIRIDRLTRL
jgi:hypothetical protein